MTQDNTIPQIFLGKGKGEVSLLPGMANRHGHIAGATGTGKTVSLRLLAEGFSKLGVPVFMADVKGDLGSMSQPGATGEKLVERATTLQIANYFPEYFPTTFWDVFGEQGHPIRATISDMGPLLLSRLLNLNETQSGVLNIIFKIADDNGLLLIDAKDLQAMVHHVGENSKEYTTQYGNISTASIGAIQRGLLMLTEQGADKFFGEPMLDVDDLMQTDQRGFGAVNILNANSLMNQPRVYSTLLLWLLSEIYERLPEVGDVVKPKLVFFFDEAHLLFHDAPSALLEKIELVVRLIRSKGVGVYFVTQSPTDIPDSVLAQLGNRVQHALRAFSPRDEKAIKSAADTFRTDGTVNVSKAITELGVGEALVSVLDIKGAPTFVEWTLIAPPQSRLGTITKDERDTIIKSSLVYGRYERAIDRESAYEKLKEREDAIKESLKDIPDSKTSKQGSSPRGSRAQSPFQAFLSSAARAIGSQVGRQIIRGVLGSIMGGSSKKKS